MKTKKIHFNKPQLKSQIIGAGSELLIMGRGGGKTTGLLAPKTSSKYFGTMPRSTGVNINATYTQAFTRTLKELIRGWQMLGLQMEHHFIVGKRPSEKWIKQWNWKGPFAPTLDYKYFVCWFNGAVMQILSQDRPGSSNGISIDWIIGDEAKLLNEEKLKTELLPANRGIIPDFVNNPYHHGMTLTTDMPVGTSGRWLLDKVNDMDQCVVNEIWELQVVRFRLAKIYSISKKPAQQEIVKQINVIDAEINTLRKGLFYYHEASSLANIHALGVDYIKQQIRDTSQFQFDTQILNIKPLRLEDGFYPDFDEDVHGYFAEDASYFDNTSIDYLNPMFDCRKDKDLNPHLPLHISMDYNRRMYPIEVAQVYDDEIRIINSLQVLYPGKIKDVCKLFIDYYKPLKKRIIYYWYDQTAVGEQRDTRLCDDVVVELRKADFIVKPMYIGLATSHKSRYETWGNLLTEPGKYTKRFRINRENCCKPILSILQAGVKQGKDGYEKNKDSEKDENFPADESTHHSEALDTLIDGILNSRLKFGNDNKGGGGILFG